MFNPCNDVFSTDQCDWIVEKAENEESERSSFPLDKLGIWVVLFFRVGKKGRDLWKRIKLTYPLV